MGLEVPGICGEGAIVALEGALDVALARHGLGTRAHQRHGLGARVLADPLAERHVGGLRVDDDVQRALAIQLHLARAVTRNRPEAHALEHPAQRLRARGRELDELDAGSAHQLGELLRAVAAYAAGGIKALVDLSKRRSSGAQKLLAQLK